MNKRFKSALTAAMLMLAAGNCPASLDGAARELARKAYAAALEQLAEVPEAQRDSREWQLLQAAALAGKGDTAAAEKRYLALIRQAPGQPEAYNNLAALYARQGRLDEARELLEQAMKSDERYSTIYANLGDIYYAMSRKAYARALQMTPDNKAPALQPLLPSAKAQGDEDDLSQPPRIGDPAAAQQAPAAPNDVEAALLDSLQRFASGDLDGALSDMRDLGRRQPKFHLAHLLEGDMLLSRTQVLSDIGQGPVLEGDGEGLAGLREEARARLQASREPLPQGRLPRALLWLDEGIHTALVMDKASHRLYVYRRGEDGTPELWRDFYATTGKRAGNKNKRGDLRTPEGVYFITGHIPDKKLPDLYGAGAYPMNYPNAWDRHLGKSGYGIWLHGTESASYSRPPLDSEGCVVLPNPDLLTVGQRLQPGLTPIIVTDQVRWMKREAWQKLRLEVAAAIEQWRSDWSSNDAQRYLAHYADDFWSGKTNLDVWRRQKEGIVNSVAWQKVSLSALSVFAYPQQAGNGREILVANFHQHYASSNFSDEMDKRLYLVKEEGRWRVLYEGRQ